MKKYNFIKEVLVYPNQLSGMGIKINSEIREFYRDDEELVVITILDGGSRWQRRVFSSGSMSEDLDIKHFYLSAKSYNGEKQNDKVIISEECFLSTSVDLANLVNGSHVLIVDDIYDTGRTLETVFEKIKEFNPATVEFCVMVERDCDHIVDINPRFVGIKLCTTEFLVGAGLDYKDDFRFLPYIGTIDTNPIIQKYFETHICNKCGEECNSKDADRDIPIPTWYGMLNAHADGQYYSPELDDCTRYKFDICEKCLKQLFNSFKIPVEEKEISPFGDDQYGW